MWWHYHGSDCGFKERRWVCHWVILPTSLYDVVMYLVLEVLVNTLATSQTKYSILIRFFAYTKLAWFKPQLCQYYLYYINMLYSQQFSVLLLVVINNTNYFTLFLRGPMVKCYHVIGPQSTFLCHLVHYRTLLKPWLHMYANCVFVCVCLCVCTYVCACVWMHTDV